jgi:hypothetical protein
MKKILLPLFALMLSLGQAQDLYDVNSLVNIEITFSQNNWDQILDTYYANDLNERLLATVVINGQTYDSVGVRYKGNSTFNPSNDKNPFNIKLDEFINQGYGDYNVLKLSTGDKDPSFVREVMGYEIVRKYMDAPKSNYAQIYVNTIYVGLYNNVESVNSDFQDRYVYSNRDATRIKCNPVDVQNGGSGLEYLGANEASYYDYYELDSDTGWSDLIDLCNITDNAPSLIEDFLDLDRAIWMLAYNNVMVNLDSYTGPFKQNYYLMKGKHTDMIPVIWDLNQNMGSFSMINQGPPGGSLAQMDILLRQNENGWPLLNLILQDDTYRRMYIAHCKTIYEENLVDDQYLTRAIAIQSVFESALQADNNAIFTFTQAQSNLSTNVNGGGGPGLGYIGLSQLFDERKTYLAGSSQFLSIPPTILDISFVESVQANTSVTVNANITNSSNVVFAYRDFQGDRFTKVALLDDGLNGDISAGDGIFSFTIPVNATDVQFYIYAENNDAGIFSPVRAEHEFHTIATYFDVVINEIQTRNNITQPDQNGEFQDWIELYNNSSSAFDLSNYYLSDKGSQLTRWQFPSGTIIQPDEYLIVWADQDTFQGGLHANFKLSGGGESVYFSDGLTIHDKIKYVYFAADASYGRLPNGTGSLSILDPSFKANNEATVVQPGIKERSNFVFQLYPNPTENQFIISIPDNTAIEVIVYDVLGKSIHKTDQKIIQTSTWSEGIYIVNVNGTSKKLIVK